MDCSYSVKMLQARTGFLCSVGTSPHRQQCATVNQPLLRSECHRSVLPCQARVCQRGTAINPLKTQLTRVPRLQSNSRQIRSSGEHARNAWQTECFPVKGYASDVSRPTRIQGREAGTEEGQLCVLQPHNPDGTYSPLSLTEPCRMASRHRLRACSGSYCSTSASSLRTSYSECPGSAPCTSRTERRTGGSSSQLPSATPAGTTSAPICLCCTPLARLWRRKRALPLSGSPTSSVLWV